MTDKKTDDKAPKDDDKVEHDTAPENNDPAVNPPDAA